jgi:hypothetical protein
LSPSNKRLSVCKEGVEKIWIKQNGRLYFG